MVTAREALHAKAKLSMMPDKTFYIALVDGYPQSVSAKGIHRSGLQVHEYMKVRARNTNEAGRKFFANDGEWIN